MALQPQPTTVRVLHWLNVLVLAVMAGSGLQILAAFPHLGPRGETWTWYPFAGVVFPEWMRAGGWLAGARHLHFALAWAFVTVGIAYVAWLGGSGEWRRRVFRPRDAGDAARTLASYLRLRNPRAVGLYNGLQRLAYTGSVVLGLVSILSGLSIWKPVQLSWLAALFGGYDGARAIHFGSLAALALFTVVHVAMVLLHPRTLLEMITGGTPKDGDVLD